MSKKKVVVIGGGLAGLTVANELKEFAQVIVLEARDRIGGRVHTEILKEGIKVELGAGWIHGISGNPVTELAKKSKTNLIEWDFEKRLVLRLASKGVVAWPKNWTAAMEELLEGSFLQKYLTLQPKASLSQAIEELRSNKEKAISKLAPWELQALLYTEITLDMAADPETLAASSMLLDDDLPGSDAIVQEGLSKLIDFLAKDLDVRLLHPVTKIIHNSQVYVGDDHVFEADAIVCTLPLNNLKNLHFEPPLPTWKVEAIHALGMGLLNKVFLLFPKLWWGDKNLDQLLCLDSSNDALTNYFTLFGRVLNGKPVLCALFAGKIAQDIEAMSDEDIVAQVMTTLRRSFGPKKHIPAPISFVLTRWLQDPWTRGSYSFVKPGAEPEARSILARPYAPIFFAGEAAAYDYPSTMHGAILSGKRAASDVLKFLV